MDVVAEESYASVRKAALHPARMSAAGKDGQVIGAADLGARFVVQWFVHTQAPGMRPTDLDTVRNTAIGRDPHTTIAGHEIG